ncbi:hypothetical protein Tco_0982247 [Tanacetum coccineum]
MEEIEAANKATVESFHRILNLLAQPKDHVQSMNLIVQTDTAVIKFKKVVLLPDDGLSHSRVRRFKKKSKRYPANILLDNPKLQEPPNGLGPKPLQFQEIASNVSAAGTKVTTVGVKVTTA